MPAAEERCRWESRVVRLELRHPWTNAMSMSDYRQTVVVQLTRDGVTGIGEGVPISRFQESPHSAVQAIDAVRPWLEGADPWQFRKVMAGLAERMPWPFAARAAVDVALHDWVGKRAGVPLYQLFGLNPEDTPITSFSIGVDDPGPTRQKVLEAEAFPILKLKMGLASDEMTMAAVRDVTHKRLRVAASEGWPTRELALQKLRWLESHGVEFVEQPMPADMVEETRWVRARVHLPIFADEAAVNAESIPKLVGAYDGVNIKIDKCGGIEEALRMIHVAKTHGLKTMLGCMIATSVNITAAAHLSPLVDYADLDGNLLVKNDPYRGVTVDHGKLVLPKGPGLGVTPA